MAKAAAKKHVFKGLSLLALSGVLLSSPLRAQSGSDDVPVGYTTPIPSELLTPDTVQTSIGTFNFFDGMPDPATVRKTFENLKFIRGYETFLTLMPAASIEMLRHGHTQVGADDHTKVVLLSPLNSNPLFLTGNTDTIYGSTFFNLQDTGPMVIEIPAGLGPGTINDAFFRSRTLSMLRRSTFELSTVPPVAIR